MGRGEPAGALTGLRARPLSLPLALLTAATGADLLGSRADLPLLWIAGAHLALAGVVVGSVAAGVRLADLSRAGERRLAVFALLAGTGLALFALARWVRGDVAIPPDPAVLLAEPLALALLWLSSRIGRRPRGREPS